MAWIKLSVVLIFVFVAKSLEISYREFEEFKKYIKKSSQLTPPLKQGIEYDYDEDEDIFDQAWEVSGKFEGDLILNDYQRELIIENVAEGELTRYGVLNDTIKWPVNEVIYAIQVDQFTNGQVQAILDAIDDIASVTCIKFRRYKKGDPAAVIITGNDTGCFSQVGYQGNLQKLNLYNRHPVGRGCFRHGIILHELLHTLGFFHTQSSPDRDEYVDIIWENIKIPYIHNFKNYNTSYTLDLGVGYDYESIMHYSSTAYSSNGKDTIVPKKDGAEIGQRLKLSTKDALKLNKMYCDDTKVDRIEFVEDVTEDINKETIKRQPSESQDIGYDKGIAVVIKLLPAPGTYKLLDVSSDLFDYAKPLESQLRTDNEACFSKK